MDTCGHSLYQSVCLYRMQERSLNTEVARAATRPGSTVCWPRSVHHCSPGPLPSCEGIQETIVSSLGSLNDMYNLSAKTGSVNKDVKPLNHFQLLKSGALWIELLLKNCRKTLTF